MKENYSAWFNISVWWNTWPVGVNAGWSIFSDIALGSTTDSAIRCEPCDTIETFDLEDTN